ncbi:DUF2867 domain-containing protein [Streptomyces sp. I05A-00742]|uniref:DUF2867 domain-containing protein n=1 Tax=Streptomyces sp. I05A-00742 TaxID=2732853 RepID=UPI001487ACFF|nr:DUF2867 domain-containing protein [Streptomyces sp. I05A-00742]
MHAVHTTHERVVEASAATVGALIERLSADDDPLFPTPAWPPMRFDRPLGPGADGGHGPVRRVAFAFTPPSNGGHELTVRPLPDGRCLVRHTLHQRRNTAERLMWNLVIRPLHDTVVAELLDNLQLAATGAPPEPTRWTPRVRLLNRLLWERPTAVPLPAGARLAHGAFARPDFADAWRLPLRPGMPRDPRRWEDTLPFPVLHRDDTEVVLGKNAPHLDFRASVRVEDDHVTLSTVVRTHNRLGRLYFGLVRHVHPAMARLMLRRAHRRLALAAPAAAARHRTPAGPGR